MVAYDIIECLGRGSYAEIYVAHDNAASDDAPETVVIKALNMFLQDAPDEELEHTLIANFQNEAVALDRVRHPNIISRLGHGTAIDLAGTTFHYIVLEYLSGGDMAALSRSQPLPIEKALFYLEQVCSGLAHAHAVRRHSSRHQAAEPVADCRSADRKDCRLRRRPAGSQRRRDHARRHEHLLRAGTQSAGANRFAGSRARLPPAANI